MFFMLVKQKTALTKPFSPPIIKASDGDEKDEKIPFPIQFSCTVFHQKKTGQE
jgi:hypothetical protein